MSNWIKLSFLCGASNAIHMLQQAKIESGLALDDDNQPIQDFNYLGEDDNLVEL